jgi:hypothetical protein
MKFATIQLIALLCLLNACYKKQHNSIVANFSLNKQTANVNDTIELIDLSSTKYVEVNYGDDSGIKKVSRNIIDKHVYLTKGIFEINVKAYEHVEGLHPHKAKFKIATKSVIIN